MNKRDANIDSALWMRRYRNVMLTLGGISLLAIGFHFFGPERRFNILASPEVVTELYGYADSETGNSAYWRNEATNNWICHYKPSAVYGCGWMVRIRPESFTGVDLTAFDAIEISLSYNGPAKRVRFLLKNFNGAYSIAGNELTSKSMNMTLPVEDVEDTVKIRFDEFKVATWWLMERTVNKRWSLPEFSGITHIGVDFAEPGLHETTVHKVAAVGHWIKTSTLMTSILGFWLLAFIGEGIARFYWQYRSVQNDRKKIRRLQENQKDLETENKALESLADTDPLTSLYNRNGLYNRIEYLECQRETLQGIGILLLDIDHFKQLNDQYGHDVGDKALKAFTSVINLHLRETDIFARLGGEEFVVVCALPAREDLMSVAEKLRRLARQSTPQEDSPFNITVSVGATHIMGDEKFADALRRADEALYRAKQNGRNRVEFLAKL